MSRRQRIRQDDLTRIVSAIRATGLEIYAVTVDPEGSVTLAVRPESVEANQTEIRAELEALWARGIERRAERLARAGRASEKLGPPMLKADQEEAE